MKRMLYFVTFLLLLMLLPHVHAFAADTGFSERTKGLAQVTAVRIGDGKDKTRIVVDADKKVTFKKTMLSNPDRVVVDIPNAWLSPKTKKEKKVSSRFVRTVRIAQFNPTTVRLVVEPKVGKNNYKVFKLDSGPVPGRVVLDFGDLGPDTTGTTIKLPSKPKPTPKTPTKTTPSKPTTPKQTPAKPKPAGSNDDMQKIMSLKGKSIMIDPGHGGNDSGAIGPTGVMEKSVTLRIANELRRLLKAEGATVYMTRTTDTEVSPRGANATDIEELQARCDIANVNKTDIFVSIHMDSFSSPDAHGTTGYYYTRGSAASKKLADRIRAGVIDQLGTESRGTQSANFYVIKHTNMPATLIETAFISNPKEEALLDSEDGIKRAAQGIADGIADYFG